GGGCDVCNVSAGSCTVVGAGSAGANPSCSPYVCDGTNASCPSSCTSDANCVAADYCNGSTCVVALGQGSACARNRQCATGFCVDGYCCNTPCGGGCDVCSATAGTCTVVSAGSAGANPACSPYLCNGASPACPATCSADTDCATGYFCNSGTCVAALASGSACSRTRQCSSDYCVGNVCCATACTSACQTCSATPGTCTVVAAGSPGTPSCSPYLCNGTNASCPTSCTSDANCVSGDYCASNLCVSKKANGAICTAANQCQSNKCVDGYCCNSDCAGGCDRCDVGGSQGTCTIVAAGNAGANPSCSPYVCSGTSANCPTTCTGDSGCIAGDYCASGSCVSKQGNGQSCTAANQCISGFCVDGYCCNAACNGACDVCNATAGTCTLVGAGGTGSPSCAPYLCGGSSAACPSTCSSDAGCSTGNFCDGATCVPTLSAGSPCTRSAACASGSCVDGYCCNTACSASCDVCNATPGTCTPAPTGSAGSPSCSPYLCNGTSTTCPGGCTTDAQCGAGFYCNGTACVAKKSTGQVCGGANQCQSGYCADGYCCNAACVGPCDLCNVTPGTCTTPGGFIGNPTCAPYLCATGTATCPTSCSQDSQCSPGNYCNGTACVPALTQGQACTRSAQCASGSCGDGFCCDTTCAGACDVCNATPGTCTNASAGAAGSPSCSPYLCSGASPTCPATCGDDAGCATGFFCNAGTCTAVLTDGATCTRSRQCQSGFCVDGVCCDTACTGACDACNLAGFAGACTVVPVGAAGSPSCAPYLCDGTSTGCPTSCTTNGQCVATSFCSGGTCFGKKSTGSACSEASECTSNSCVDGYCCETACGNACDTCAAIAGSCTVAAGGSAGSPSCTPYLCNGAQVSCPTTCASDVNCAAGYYCDGLACQPKQATGSPCTAPNACVSGFCADGYCCNTACAGGCDACNASPGTCAVVTAGGAGSPSCAPYVCDGTAAACPTTCTSDANCTATSYCAGGTCTGRHPNGTACAAPHECASGNCADGYCCDGACAGACDRCDLLVGKCTPVATGQPGSPSCSPYLCDGVSPSCPTTCSGDGACAPGSFCQGGLCVAPLPNGQPCTRDVMCSSAHCSDGYCCNTACGGACDECASTAGTCKLVAQGSAGTPSCVPYVCDGASAACPSGCLFDTDCAPADFCNAGVCSARQPNGAVCSRDRQCSSGHCMDSYCCDTVCDGACNACNLAAAEGTCSLMAQGAAGAPSCRPYVCDGVTPDCPSSCTDTSQCATGAYCSGGACYGRQPNGVACTDAAQCWSNSCVDGVCCASACNLPCDVCNRAGSEGSCVPSPVGSPGSPSCSPYVCNGTATTCPTFCASDLDCTSGLHCLFGACLSLKPIAAPCGSAAECVSGNCYDGVCCDMKCDGACSVCNLTGLVGACSPAAAGTDPRGLCPGSGPCKAICGTGGLCVYPDTTKPCGAAAVCSSSTVLHRAFACNGNGACADQGSVDCAPYLCSTPTCPTSCIDDSVCASGSYCDNGSCGERRALGAACTTEDECASGYCVDGVCCDSACDGTCQRCDRPPTPGGVLDGVCRAPVGEDPDVDCAGDGLCAGACAADFTCSYPGPDVLCDTCKACNRSGACNQFPTSGDDPACLSIACGALSTECRTYPDLEADRCGAVGLCARPNDPATCTAYTDLADGTGCTDGVCYAGSCVAELPDGGLPPGSDGGTTPETPKANCGCGASTAPPGGLLVMLVAAALAACRRRKKPMPPS
ncbi:MAG: hypothetical protein HY906_25225, partial [Deltaproteobacteria bacterium]|nr:hypothetical protein [Deltaproteobacteria bacterium]